MAVAQRVVFEALFSLDLSAAEEFAEGDVIDFGDIQLTVAEVETVAGAPGVPTLSVTLRSAGGAERHRRFREMRGRGAG